MSGKEGNPARDGRRPLGPTSPAKVVLLAGSPEEQALDMASSLLFGELTPKGTTPPVNTWAALGSGVLVFSSPCKVEGITPT